MEEKHDHTSIGTSPGIAVPGAGSTVFAAASFGAGAGVVEIQVEIAGDWVSMGLLSEPKHLYRDTAQEGVRELSGKRFAFNFVSPQGAYNYRWACTRYRHGTITTYIAA